MAIIIIAKVLPSNNTSPIITANIPKHAKIILSVVLLNVITGVALFITMVIVAALVAPVVVSLAVTTT